MKGCFQFFKNDFKLKDLLFSICIQEQITPALLLLLLLTAGNSSPPFAKVSEDDLLAANEAALPTNTKSE